MPTYEYACKDCDHHFEVVQSFAEDALTECPTCGGNLRKVFSAAGIIFKGSGWHIKDYATSGSPSVSKESGEADSAGGNGKGAGDKASTSGGSESGSSSTSEKKKSDSGDSTPSSANSTTSSSTSDTAKSA